MTLSTQFITMLSMIGMGSVFGAMFDTYQRFLNRPKRKQWIVFINDLLFWIIQALLIFYTLFMVNDGELRFYIFIALLCGFAAYQSLFKGIYLKLLEVVIQTVIATINFLKKTFRLLIYKPVLGLIQLVIAIIIAFGRGIFTLVKFIFKVVLFILKIIIFPVQKILLLFWKLLPKGIKKSVEKLYNKTAGNFKGIKNYINTFINKWKKRKE
ncbi:spore cortex biosynthesis protein YabQ [Bacillus sp. SLBN-46]|jgi:spore cortex biosynthesis protein YabQ|uniref:spore cortex biosynthesis protein YabQ n=1 Tax=Bacillus sp. SLBN-46 TaxID=3042283 RepID=UPI00285D1A02|nr:spore cortex biosynthesis protein YabQ [Bacillus sp. SLBN-46]MDR6120769.1 spore cortex biosynthesis protein YabQ [Bacillus sp. SLBN-46]